IRMFMRLSFLTVCSAALLISFLRAGVNTDLNSSPSKAESISFSDFSNLSLLMVASKIFLSSLTAWNHCFEENRILILYIGDKMGVPINIHHKNLLIWVFLFIRVS